MNPGWFVKTLRCHPLLRHALILALGLMPAGPVLAQTYTFGMETQSTNTASITYNSGTGQFQYTDAANLTDDHASIPLTGGAAGFITATSSWHASVSINVSAKSMTATAADSPEDGVGLSVVYSDGAYYVSMIGGQINNTGDAGPDFPDHDYGTGAHFFARINGVNQTTTPLGASVLVDSDSFLLLTAQTNLTAATESVGSNNAVVSLDYNAATKFVTGYHNGVAVGKYSIAGWGSNPALTLYVFGSSGGGIAVTGTEDTATNFNASTGTFTLPPLTAVHSGTGCILQWPTNATGFTLQSSTNLLSATGWTNVTTAPAVVNTNNVVTNSLTGPPRYFRLLQN
jgi:hypothetical protein